MMLKSLLAKETQVSGELQKPDHRSASSGSKKLLLICSSVAMVLRAVHKNDFLLKYRGKNI